MRKLSIAACVVLVAISGIYFAACNKTASAPQVVTNTNELTYTKKTAPLFFEFTSTGCGGCGSWGKPTFKSIVKEHGNSITPLAVHIKYGDNMITYESTAIGANRHGQFYTPQLWVGDENAMVLSGGINSTATIENVNKLLNEGKTINQPSLAAVVTRDGDNLNVSYGVKFIDIVPNGEYGITAFLTEDGYKAYQVSAPVHPETHTHIIRAASAGAFGEKFTKEDLTNLEKRWTHSFDISKYKDADVYITVVLWKKEGIRYKALNGYVAR